MLRPGVIDVTVAEAVLPPDSQRALVTELAALALDSAAPEELAVFDDTAEEYFTDPGALLDPKRRDEALGFGISTDLLAPYVLAAATPVVRFLVATLAAAVQEEARPRLETLIRRLFRRGGAAGGDTAHPPHGGPAPASDPDDGSALALSADQARRVREIALDRAKAIGLGDRRAELLADALVGSLVVAK